MANFFEDLAIVGGLAMAVLFINRPGRAAGTESADGRARITG
jgi:hypothetical protein